MADSQLEDIYGDIAYDWINKKIYVADSRRGKILLANTDGSDVVTVLNVDHPLAIALHPCQGFSCFRSYFVSVLTVCSNKYSSALVTKIIRNSCCKGNGRILI